MSATEADTFQRLTDAVDALKREKLRAANHCAACGTAHTFAVEQAARNVIGWATRLVEEEEPGE